MHSEASIVPTPLEARLGLHRMKCFSQSLRLFGLHRDVNDAHRASANRLQNKQTFQSWRIPLMYLETISSHGRSFRRHFVHFETLWCRDCSQKKSETPVSTPQRLKAITFKIMNCRTPFTVNRLCKISFKLDDHVCASSDSICHSDVSQGLLSLMYVVISMSFSGARSNTTRVLLRLRPSSLRFSGCTFGTWFRRFERHPVCQPVLACAWALAPLTINHPSPRVTFTLGPMCKINFKLHDHVCAPFDSICFSDVSKNVLSIMYVVISLSFSSAQYSTTLEVCRDSDRVVSGFAHPWNLVSSI